jgi:RHS repeat-associated protein
VGNARSESYSYDLNGNRNMTGWSTGGNNRLTGDGTFTYLYDNEGNLLSKTRLSDSQQWTFTWDYRNRLTQAVVKTSAGVTVASDVFTYDIEDRRIGKSTNGTQTWTFYNGQNPYADFNGSGSLTYRYLYGKGLDQLFARYDGTASKWYLTDNIGSVRLFVTTGGTILDQLSYDSYGNILTETNSANGDRFKYTARDWDGEIGLQYNRARYYDPKAGRWISQDVLGFRAGDANLYRYVANAPTDYVDPSGLDRTVGFFGHMWIRVDAYDDAGNKIGCVYLHFSPNGYTVENTSVYPEWFSFETIPSTAAQDKALVEVWHELETQRQKVGGPGSQFTGFNNCWVPVLTLYDFPEVPLPKHGDLSGKEWLHKFRGK